MNFKSTAATAVQISKWRMLSRGGWKCSSAKSGPPSDASRRSASVMMTCPLAPWFRTGRRFHVEPEPVAPLARPAAPATQSRGFSNPWPLAPGPWSLPSHSSGLMTRPLSSFG